MIKKYLRIRTYKSTKTFKNHYKNLPKTRANIQAILSLIRKPQGRVRSGPNGTDPPQTPPKGLRPIEKGLLSRKRSFRYLVLAILAM